MVCKATFNNISVVSWLSISLVEETIDLSQVTDKLVLHNVVSRFKLTTLMVIGSCKSNCRTVTTTTALIYSC